jgi:hypothetical protein
VKALGYLLAAGVALSALKAAVVVILSAISLLALWGVLFRPREMTQFAVILTCWWLLQNYPAVTLGLASIGALRALVAPR